MDLGFLWTSCGDSHRLEVETRVSEIVSRHAYFVYACSVEVQTMHESHILARRCLIFTTYLYQSIKNALFGLNETAALMLERSMTELVHINS